MLDMVLLQFLAQRAAIDAEAKRGLGLVVVAVTEHGLEHGLFDLGDHRVEQVAGQFAVEIFEVFANRCFHRLLQLTRVFLFCHSHKPGRVAGTRQDAQS